MIARLAHPRRSCRLYLRLDLFAMRRCAPRGGDEMSERGWKRISAGAVLATVVGLAAVLAASVPAASSAGTRLTVRSTEFGKAVFGPNGKVVYVFGADRGSGSRCYGVCAAAWPPVLTQAAPQAGAGVEAKLLGATKRKDGRLQVTYNGH